MTAVTTIAENDDEQKAPKMRADQICNDPLVAKDWSPLGYMYRWGQTVTSENSTVTIGLSAEYFKFFLPHAFSYSHCLSSIPFLLISMT